MSGRADAVPWTPWGPEAFARAAAEDRPVLVVVLSASCHWCHVMERECFAEPAIAALMAENVCVLVDREERPDVDAFCMAAVQTLTGEGCDGVEGTFSTWTLAELEAALDGDAADAVRWFGATREGHLDGRNVLEDRGPRPDDATVARIRARLLLRRDRRVRPARDERPLTSWNALAIAAFADAGRALGRADHLETARACATFVLAAPRRDGLLPRVLAGRPAMGPAFLEDHAFLLEALLVLHDATGEARWLAEARGFGELLLARFEDAEHGGFFATGRDDDPLLPRRKELEDVPVPSGGSSAALGLLRLAARTGEQRYADAAIGQFAVVGGLAGEHPLAFGHLLLALDEQRRRP